MTPLPTTPQAPTARPGTVAGVAGSSCLLFLLGSERSGTTFVQQTLAEFYAVSPGNESQWVISAYRRFLRKPTETVADQRRFIKTVFADWYFANKVNYHNIYFDPDQFIQDHPFDFRQFVENVFLHIAEADRNQWVLNKTCKFCAHMDVVDQIFDGPRVVGLIRDGRDVAQSLIKAQGWGPTGIYGAARWWSRRVDMLQHYATRHMQDRYLEIRYEELIADPVQSYERIARFYGIFDPHRHVALAEAVRIKPHNAGKWRTQLSATQVRLFEKIAGETLQRNGYVLTSARIEPLTAGRTVLYELNESISSRLGLYPLWYRGLRTINRLIASSTTLQKIFFRSKLFKKHFNWNKNIGIEDKD